MIQDDRDLLNIQSSTSGKSWKLKNYSEKEALSLTQHFNLPSVVAQMLSARGHTTQTASSFLNPAIRSSLPDPSILKDMDIAVARIQEAIKLGQKIAVFGDYDVDGATSSALLYRYFRSIGIPIRVYIPDRIDEGYGPNEPAFQALHGEGISLVITVDCGTTAFEPLAYAKEIGLDLIVIDHHVAEPKLPKAVAIVNPNRLDEPMSPLQQLAAVGVSFLLVVALNRSLRKSGYFQNMVEPDLLSLLDLVALGTVCDVMPLQGLNRAYVKQGLKILGRRENIGLKVLSDITGIDGHPTTYHLGFILGPRINAGGRVGEASLGSQLLRAENSTEAEVIARKLDEYNLLRKEIEQEVLKDSFQQAAQQFSPVILVSGENWHPGVIGIVAGRLKERFSRPSCVVSIDSNGIGKGSARSIPGLDLGSMIHAAKQQGLLLAGGGHTMAAGFTVEKEKLKQFHEFLSHKFTQFLPDGYLPSLDLDGIINIRTLTSDFVRKIDLLAPFGAGNPTPKFALKNVRINHASIVGSEHIRITIGQLDGARLNAIAFRSVDTNLGHALLNHKGSPLHLAGSVKLDSWLGQEKVQFIIEDVASATEVFAKTG